MSRRDTSRLLTVVGLLSLVLPAVAYFWFVHHYGVNMIWNDQWDDIRLIGQSYSGKLTLSTLWAQHNENRIFFPDLIVLALAYTTHFNVKIELYLSAVMLTVSTALIILAHHRRAASTPWIYYCPVAILTFTFVGGNPFWGGGNTLWGFQMAWYLAMLALAVTVFLVDRPALTGPVLAGAIAAAVVGSFSSLQGLLIWPVGLALLYLRRRSRGIVLVWIASAIATAIVYFYHYSSQSDYGKFSFLTAHPLAAVKFFLFSIGENIIGGQIGNHGSSDAELIVGLVILGIALWVLIAYGLRRDETSGTPVGVALVWMGLLFTAMITIGRSFQGPLIANRYVMFELLTWVGCYLAFLDRPTPPLGDSRWDRLVRLGVPRGVALQSSGVLAADRQTHPLPRRESVKVIVQLGLVGLIVVQLVLGTSDGLVQARVWHRSEVAVADVTVNINKASDPLVASYLADLPPAFIRQTATTARVHKLSLFDTSAVAEYTRQGLFPWLLSQVLVPRPGTTVSGTTVLDASVFDDRGVSKVTFQLTGVSVHDGPIVRDRLVGTARLTTIGWIAVWDTRTVANGVYKLQSVLTLAGGKTAPSHPQWFAVKNKP